jgi:diguanylate cyclase (GGDEF)-like protein
MARAATALYLAGATLVVATLFLPHDFSTDVAAILVLVALAYMTGAALWVLGPRLPDWSFQVLTAIGSLLISGAVHFGGQDFVAYSVLYVWVAIYSAYFFQPWQAVAQLILLAIASAAVLVSPYAHGHAGLAPGVIWLMTVGTSAVAAAFINRVVERIRVHARTDFLTGAANRWAWDLELQRTIQEAPTGICEAGLVVALLDLDHFRVYNEEHGNRSGDRLLQEVSARWRKLVGPGDVLARHGGEEFAVLIRDATPAAALALVDRLRQVTPHGHTCSAGLAVWDGSEPADALMARADEALFDAKRQGRNRTVLAPAPSLAFDSSPLHDAARWSSPVTRLLTGRSPLKVAYQPIVELDSGRVVGYEALARPQESPEGGVDGLFRAAQRMGSIRELDRLCVQAGARAAAELPPGVPVFLNIGVATLLDPAQPIAQLLATLIAELEAGGLSRGPAARPLVLEITERETVTNSRLLSQVVARCRELGIRFALDDVGAGHSDVELMAALMPDYIKLDRRLSGRPARANESVVAAMVAFGASSGAVVLAEGIEDEPTAARMRERGVLLGQGYHLGRPAWASDWAETIRLSAPSGSVQGPG